VRDQERGRVAKPLHRPKPEPERLVRHKRQASGFPSVIYEPEQLKELTPHRSVRLKRERAKRPEEFLRGKLERETEEFLFQLSVLVLFDPDRGVPRHAALRPLVADGVAREAYGCLADVFDPRTLPFPEEVISVIRDDDVEPLEPKIMHAREACFRPSVASMPRDVDLIAVDDVPIDFLSVETVGDGTEDVKEIAVLHIGESEVLHEPFNGSRNAGIIRHDPVQK
jgi:hypothetical protein